VLGTEIPLDPGDHSLEILAPGRKPWRDPRLNLGPAAAVTRVKVTLDEEAPPATPNAPGALPGAPPPSPPEPGVGSGKPGKRIFGYTIGALGLASVGVAVAEEIVSIGRSNDESKYMAGSGQRQTVADQSSLAQTYAIVFGAAGVAAIGAGVYLVLTSGERAPAPAGARVAPLLGRGLAGAALHFDW
jgi:hypothetical protein